MTEPNSGATQVSPVNITAAMIKELREKTSAGMMECRKALDEAHGDIERAVLILREKGILAADKKKDRKVSEGQIEAYIHFGGKIGTLVEVNCETDFVAKTKEFHELCKNLAMQVAASSPRWVSRDQVPPHVVQEERNLYRTAAEKDGKKGDVLDKIADGKMEKFFQTYCLLEQPYIKDPDRSVSSVIKETIAKVGENIVVRRFIRFGLGEAKD